MSRQLVLLFLLVTMMTSSGCEPFRKKFTRKKKVPEVETTSEVILDPVVYPDQVKLPQDVYTQHYSLLKVWVGDLQMRVEENANDKKIRYTLEQIQEQLLAMRGLLAIDHQKKIDPCLDNLTEITAAFEKPAELRNKTIILSQIRGLSRRMKDIKIYD